MQAEWVTLLPEDLKPNPLANFKGVAVVEDWYGNFLKAYAYDGLQNTIPLVRTESATYKASFNRSITCYTYPIYNYNYVPSMPELGYFSYIAGYETYCSGSGGSGGDLYDGNPNTGTVINGGGAETGTYGNDTGDGSPTGRRRQREQETSPEDYVSRTTLINNFVLDYEDQIRFPKFTNLLKELKSFVKNDTKVLEALKQWSGFSETEILNKVEFGQGPKIIVKDLIDKYGYFNKVENPNVINIDASWVRSLETANLLSTRQATGFLLAVTVLHEFVHQARASNGLDRNLEYGIKFENSAFGLVIESSNAGNYSYRFSENEKY